MKVVLEKRLEQSLKAQIGLPVLSALMALVFCGVFFALTGKDPLLVYESMFSGALGNDYGLSETFVKMIPMALCALGIAVAFRMQIWNIGAEGQFYMGACAATWVPLNFPDLPAAVMLPAMFILGALAGGLWGLVAGWFKTKWLVNELISTLMMNYIAILWVDYLVYGDWRDPNGLNFPLTAAFPDAAMLPSFGDLRVHAGIFVVFIAAAVFTVLFKSSRWGYETMVIGSNPAAARYAGMDIARNVLIAMFISGAVCGLAGMVEVSGIVGKLQHGISPGYGYTAIIIAWLARLNPPAIILVSFLFAVIHVGGFMLQTMGISAAAATMLQGAVLFFAQCPYDKVLGASNLAMLRYEWVWYKSRCTGFLNARRAPLKKTENILVFYQKLPLYNPQFEQGKPYKKIAGNNGNSTNYGKFTRSGSGSEDGLRFPGNVLTFPAVQRTVHPTQKPVELCEYFIKTYTRPGEVVADICAGSATTAVAALNTGRRFICFETVPAYYAAATERIRLARAAVEAGEKGV